jgi:antitoxin (DNA-binding transcriptional repressor) of toxin-antitoxin stability system
MSTQTVGIREFRDKLAKYLLESNGPVAITRHGDTIGFYLPVRRRPTEAEKRALAEAHARLQEEMAATGVTEEDMIEEFRRLRKQGSRRKGAGK